MKHSCQNYRYSTTHSRELDLKMSRILFYETLQCRPTSLQCPSLQRFLRCRLGDRKGTRPIKTETWGAGVVVCLERGADLHMAQLLDATATHCLLLQYNPDWFYLSGTGSPG